MPRHLLGNVKPRSSIPASPVSSPNTFLALQDEGSQCTEKTDANILSYTEHKVSKVKVWEVSKKARVKLGAIVGGIQEIS